MANFDHSIPLIELEEKTSFSSQEDSDIVFKRQNKGRIHRDVTKRVSFHEDVTDNSENIKELKVRCHSATAECSAYLEAMDCPIENCQEAEFICDDGKNSQQFTRLRSDSFSKLLRFDSSSLNNICYGSFNSIPNTKTTSSKKSNTKCMPMPAVISKKPVSSYGKKETFFLDERGAPEGQEDVYKYSSTLSISDKLNSLQMSSNSLFLSDHESSKNAIMNSSLSSESIESSVCTKMLDKGKISKSLLVSRFLQSVPNQTTVLKRNLLGNPRKKERQLLYIRNVSIDDQLQGFLKNQLNQQISSLSSSNVNDKYKFNVTINSQLQSFFSTETLFYPNEEIYKIYRVLHTDGSPLLAVLTNYSVYIVGMGSCRCIYKLKYVIWYEKLAAVAIGPSSQIVIFVNEYNKNLYMINTAPFYGTAHELTTFLEMAIRKWCRSNNKAFIFSGLEIKSYYDTNCFRSLIPKETFSEDEEIVFHSWIWLQEEYVDAYRSPLGPQKEGHIMFRSSMNSSWTSCYIRLKGGVLYVFEKVSQRLPKHAIAVSSSYCKCCRHTSYSSRPYTFEILMEGNFQYLFGAANETEMIEWLQLLVAVAAGTKAPNIQLDEKEPILCGYFILMTTSQLILYQHPNKIVNSCYLPDLICLKEANHSECLYCLLEFNCREASEESGDWILHFVCQESYNEFCSRLLKMKPNLLSEIDSVIDNDLLISRCDRVNYQLQTIWDPLLNPIK